MCRPGHAPSRHPPTGGHTGPPLQREGEVPATTQASGAQRSVCAADGRKGLESRQRSSPKCPATSDNPSVTAAPCQLPLHKGALGDGGCGLPRRPVGPPRNDNGFLSFRGAERRGNPSFLRWTGVRAAVPRAWPPPTKFRSEIWGVGQVVVPYGMLLSGNIPRPVGGIPPPPRPEWDAVYQTFTRGQKPSILYRILYRIR